MGMGTGGAVQGPPPLAWPPGSYTTEMFIFGELGGISFLKKNKTQNIKLICLLGR